MRRSIHASEVNTIIFACEAGMGISLMSGNWLKKQLDAAGIIRVGIKFLPAREVPQSAQLVVVHKVLAPTVQIVAPNALIVAYERFSNDPILEKLVRAFIENTTIYSTEA